MATLLLLVVLAAAARASALSAVPLTVRSWPCGVAPRGSLDCPSLALSAAVGAGANGPFLVDLRASVVAVRNATACDAGQPCYAPTPSAVVCGGNWTCPWSGACMAPQSGGVLVNETVTWAAGSSSAVILVVNDPSAAPAYLGLQGHVGLAQAGNDSSANWLAAWFDSHPAEDRAWALDARLTINGSSTLTLGGLPPSAAEVQWAETNELSGCASIAGYYMRAFHLSVCGVNLFGNLTSNYLAGIDTVEPCLVLPSEVFDAALAWLPVVCDEANATTGLPCTLAPTAVDAVLPAFQFRLSENGPELTLPLAYLVVNGTGVCLRRRTVPNVSGFWDDNSSAAFVIFGAMALQPFTVVANWTTHRVGLAPTVPTPATATHLCSTSVAATCKPLEAFYAAGNQCVEPGCALYMFQVYDRAQGVCVVQYEYMVAIATIVAVLAATEWLQGVGLSRLVRRAVRQRERAAAVS